MKIGLMCIPSTLLAMCSEREDKGGICMTGHENGVDETNKLVVKLTVSCSVQKIAWTGVEIRVIWDGWSVVLIIFRVTDVAGGCAFNVE